MATVEDSPIACQVLSDWSLDSNGKGRGSVDKMLQAVEYCFFETFVALRCRNLQVQNPGLKSG
ncbi:MAG TPA: hypothetical protein VGM52_05280 [Herbaspirillum sp.]